MSWVVKKNCPCSSGEKFLFHHFRPILLFCCLFGLQKWAEKRQKILKLRKTFLNLEIQKKYAKDDFLTLKGRRSVEAVKNSDDSHQEDVKALPEIKRSLFFHFSSKTKTFHFSSRTKAFTFWGKQKLLHLE